ncbi:hypothetical protein GBA52_016454 [Prunus armeniaca]|nr:hypothetical protein GBA52_016454 [Prunus armeniaca]
MSSSSLNASVEVQADFWSSKSSCSTPLRGLQSHPLRDLPPLCNIWLKFKLSVNFSPCFNLLTNTAVFPCFKNTPTTLLPLLPNTSPTLLSRL